MFSYSNIGQEIAIVRFKVQLLVKLESEQKKGL